MSVPNLGWYMYAPIDLKKQKTAQRWITVNDYWLEISMKPVEPPLITIHLGFTSFRPPNPDEVYPINSLVLNTSSYIGDWQIVLSTNNRFEILDLNEALVKGKEAWNSLMASGLQQTSFDSSFKDKNYGLLGRNVECSISENGFKTMRSQTESTTFKFENCIYIRPVRFDTRQGACFEMNIKPERSQRADMLFQCHDHNEMKKFLTIFLYHLVTLKRPQENATE